MRIFGCLNMLLACLGLAATRVEAQDAATIADIRCVIIGVRLSEMANPTQQSKGLLLSLYYLGRLDGRSPKLDIEHLLLDEFRTMAGTDYASEGKRCGVGLTEKGQQLVEIGNHLREAKIPDRQAR
jgi:hypothetical protein